LILCDIEGTTTSIAFVHETLFPYARMRLREFVETHREEARVRRVLDEVRETISADVAREVRSASPLGHADVSDDEAVDALLRWIDSDRKHAALKRLQGWIWACGYAAGELVSHVYDDVPPALARWKAAGKTLGIYSSGSVEAQRQLFSRTPAGDLSSLFSFHFDTSVGAKREVASYAEITSRTGVPAGETLFLSDVKAELDAARTAGMRTTQLVRAGTTACNHLTAHDFTEVQIDP
jgi:enolase-phosphatase E1